MIKAVIFDLDDTLYNEKDFVIGGFKAVCAYLSEKYGADCNKLFNETNSILIKKGRGAVFDILCEIYGYNENICKLVSIYRNAMPELKLYDDSIYILNKLRGKYKLGLITDGLASVQWNKIKLLNIENCFDKIIVTDDLGRDYWKPNEFAYNEILKYFKVNSAEAVYVGDNPHKDFIGAKKAGMNTVRILREYGDHIDVRLDEEHEADIEITDLKQLLDIINSQLLHKI